MCVLSRNRDSNCLILVEMDLSVRYIVCLHDISPNECVN